MNTPNKYEKLDTAILNKISGHPQRFISIYVRDVEAECKRLAAEEGKDSHDIFRICDRRLQALRKAGKIRATSKGWIKVEAA